MQTVNDLGQPIGVAVPNWQSRPEPEAVCLTGRLCRIEPLNVDEHAADLYRALHHDSSGRQWTYMAYGPFRDRESFEGFLTAATADPSLIVFTIVSGESGRAEGMASLSRIDPQIGSVEIGGIMFGPVLRRTATATEAMYLLAEYVFDGLGYRRYEWKCDSLNSASIAAATRLGFCYEGTWRNATIYKGRNRDTAWLAMTDGDWTVARPIIRAWLDPSNFVDGKQRMSLSQAIQTHRSAEAKDSGG
ncbi:GNAT family N-acetyltransferase [Micromonospora yasonensis]|uniref:GNAT family N-acetyltransferase n=1 Tax=Micromonospora yasonensis TaxID=1128667 RepID=UPI0022317A41|nr:GNAT family protein [Micromonospora yasonensis]MCW3838557.1 GNAT family N-acetyltransferase [Micromonospora yasonensis]